MATKKRPAETCLEKKDSKRIPTEDERNYLHPCKTCRKKDSCLISPIGGSCTGWDEGPTWTAQYEDQLRRAEESATIRHHQKTG